MPSNTTQLKSFIEDAEISAHGPLDVTVRVDGDYHHAEIIGKKGATFQLAAGARTRPNAARVRPEYVQLALGELGEASMKEGEACYAGIERACVLLRAGEQRHGLVSVKHVERVVRGVTVDGYVPQCECGWESQAQLPWDTEDYARIDHDEHVQEVSGA